jgi:uncharacterized NAD(P)/FAD-binding protein YdhS
MIEVSNWTASETRMPWQLKVLDALRRTGYWLLTMLGLIALWGATGASMWSAMEAHRTAEAIARMEEQRLDYEKNKYTAEIFAKYAEFVSKSRPILPCARALNELDETKELKNILDEPAEFDFRPDDTRHIAILDCLDPAERQRIAEHKVPWSADHRRQIRAVIIDWANQLDAMVLPFNYDVANKFILCRNFSSFTMQKDRGQIKLLFDKINKMKIWPGAPNLWAFMDQFKTPSDNCEEFPGKPRQPPK